MKKLSLLIFLFTFMSTFSFSFAEEWNTYSFFDGEYSIDFPSYFHVIHEDAEDTSFIDQYDINLVASYDRSEKVIFVYVRDNFFKEDNKLSNYDDCLFLGEAWAESLKEDDYSILFVEPYIGESNNMVKIAFKKEYDGEVSYYLDYLGIFNGDLVSFECSSDNGQFDIEDANTLNKCADSIDTSVVTVGAKR